ncbi:MAG: hypothetical protein ACKV2T_39095 [Kofleriaceae bacterium]
MRFFVPLVFVFGCADDGALDQVSVGTECSPTDFACVTSGLNGPIAVGGVLSLSLDLDTQGTSSAAISLVSADPSVLDAKGTEVIGAAAGVAALVMLAEGRAVDFLHVYVVEPNRIGLHRRDGGLELGEILEEVEMLVGDEMIVDVEPYFDSQRLLGNRTTAWSSGPEVSLLRDGSPGRRRVVARTAGTTDLVVDTFGFQKTLHITVLP